ncbi:class IV lanthionine synthetase LanL [Streptosporangium sp. NPDC001559]|uniref:class IV lanthionine synthetase LanL n=1 Tax=Streptosporangium sp. NPDC001559 TaxID=3366187 RepID=UPI0036EB146E
MTGTGDDGLLAILRAELGTGAEAASWETRAGDFWFHVEPLACRHRVQGWKLHLSAVPGNAEEVLRRAARVLLPLRVPFKFVGTVERLRRSLSRDHRRAEGGKFLTVYPAGDEQCAELAEALHLATEGLSGPGILSDRPYREGGLVHYRYGGFAALRDLDDHGLWRDVLVAPDGSLTPDDRLPWFAPPPWARDPFPPSEQEQEQTGDGELLLAGRYRVTGAVRHSNKGGVYRAEDTRRDGAPVVIKQGRPWFEADEDGRDVRDLLRNEEAVLRHLAPTGVVPGLVGTYEVDGHLFLVQEEVAGTSLRALAAPADLADSSAPPPLDRERVLELAGSLLDLVSVVHKAGVVVRDLSPANVIVRPDGRMALVDLEAAVLPGGVAGRLATPGYAAPEQRASAADPAADRYGVGALIALLCLRQEPLVPPGGDVTVWVRYAARHFPVAGELAEAVEGLMRERPEERWELERARAFLDGLPATPCHAASLFPAAGRDGLIQGSLAFLLDSMDPDGTALWPANVISGGLDPCTVQFGAAGGTGVLVQVWERAERSERLDTALWEASRWYDRNLDTRPGRRVLPGLYAGHAGPCLAAYETALAVNDDVTARRALAMARRLPVRWATPDVFHGTAGAGLALVRLHELSGAEDLAERWRACADGVLLQAREAEGGGLWWPDAGSDSIGPYYGFAHGCAGIGTFLLAAGVASGEDAYTDAARRTGDLLVRAAVREDGAAWWGEGPGRAERRLAHWCHGSSGIGTFLLRLWLATDHVPYRELAEEAAAAVHTAAPIAPLGACHGISGDGQFLLDLADALFDPIYYRWAGELADMLTVRAGLAGGLPVAVGDCWERPYADHATGVAGALSFLVRQRYGGPRPWLPAR